MNLLKVVLPYKWSTGYTYEGDFSQGSIVNVTVKNRLITGVVIGKGEQISDPKKITSALLRPINATCLAFLIKAAEYNMLYLGEVLSMTLRKWSDQPSWYLWNGELCSISRLSALLGHKKFAPLIKAGALTPTTFLATTDRGKLTKDQQTAFDQLILGGANLLRGATGSGKTAVYLKAVGRFLGRQCLILVPEIALTENFVRRVYEIFGFWPHVWHHKVTPKTKDSIWSWALSGEPGIIIGSRSALWLPFSNLGCIVVDEEHDEAYKQEQAPRYNCRDMAVLRASIEKIPIILVSATPSLESWHNVKKGKYHLVTLAGEQTKNAIIVKRGYREWLTVEAKEAIMRTIREKGQILLFLNRRGFATNLFCTCCGTVTLCKYCSASLLIYKNMSTKCSYCGYTSIIKPCETCGKNAWQMYGVGIEKVFDELGKIFPKAKITMLSSDSKELEEGIQSIHNSETDIIIATQILSKGYHFPNLRLIVILQGDQNMSSGDPRNTEKIYQLLTQVKGRFGSNNEQNLVMIQSINPQNKIIQAIASSKFQDWAEEELANREKYFLPPFYSLIRIIIGAKTYENSYADAQYIYTKIKDLPNIKVYQPAPTHLYQYKGQIRNSIIIQHKNTYPQKELFDIISSLKLPKKSTVITDVDPRSFF